MRVWALAAMLLCLLGATYAQSGVAASKSSADSHTFVVPLQPHCSQARKVEVSLSASKSVQAAWDVSISIDTSECKMYCTYKRKRNSDLPASLLHLDALPVATIRVYENRSPETTLVVLDPSGLQSRGAAAYLTCAPPPDGTTSRKYLASAISSRREALPLVQSVRTRTLPFDFPAPIAALTPLRI